MTMFNRLYKQSKRGFALPTVIAVCCVIVIFATTLIGIAVTSTKNTSADIDRRQAYLNAKSALNYGAAYYGDGSNLPALTVGTDVGEELILFNDKLGGTTEQGANIAGIAASTSDYKTFVHTTYDRANSSLKMTAFAKSSDSTGGHQKSTTLSVTYKVGSTADNAIRPRPTTPMRTRRTTTTDEVTIHTRRDPNSSGTQWFFNPAIYTWSYYKKPVSAGWNNVNYTGQVNTDFSKITVNEMNSIESEGNKFEPAGKWVTKSSGGVDGPVTKMEQDKLGNDWFSHTFSPSKAAQENGGSSAEMVPWFNLIISRQGAGVGNKADGTQSCEFLNVWYFDENDKNIYVEVQHSPLYYYKGRNWDGQWNLSYYESNGTKVLQDCVIAYANAPQTVYYVKQQGKVDNTLAPTISISGGYGGGSMFYSGYGWWSYRSAVPYKESPNVTVSGVGTSTITLNGVSSGTSNPIMNGSAYIVIDAAGSMARSYIDEESAAYGMGDEDYVTVYAKAYNNKKSAAPKISYLVETHQSSKAKERLANEIHDADQLYFADYTTDSWNAFITVLNNAKKVYNKSTLQTNAEYNNQITNIKNAKNDLKFKPVDTSALEAKIADVDSKDPLLYTTESFSALKNVRNQAQTVVDNAKDNTVLVKQQAVDAQVVALQAKIDALEEIQQFRDQLQVKINEGKQAQINHPDSPNIGQLNTAISTAEGLLNSNGKTAINNAITNLTKAINKVLNSVSTVALEQAIQNGNNIINTDSSKLVSGSVTNLANTISIAENALNTSTLSEDQVNAYVNAINDAINKLIYIPKDTISDLASGKKRVWFDISNFGAGEYYVYAYYGEGGAGKQNVAWCAPGKWSEYPEIKLKKDTNSPYYYYDLENKYTDVILVLNDRCNQNNGGSKTFKYDENKPLCIVNGPRNNSRGEAARADEYAKISTLYSEVDSPWGTATQYSYVRGSAHSGFNSSSLTANSMLTKDSSGKYYLQRIAYDDSSKLFIHNGSDSGNNRTVDIPIKKDATVILYTDKNPISGSNVAVTTDSLENILQSNPVTNINANSNSNPNASNAGYKPNSQPSVVNTAASSDPHVSTVNSIITLYFLKPNNSWQDVYAELSKVDNSGNIIPGTTQSNMCMITEDGNYYSLTVDTNNANSIKIADPTNSSRKTQNIKFAVDPATNTYYGVQQVYHDGSTYKISMFTAPEAVIANTEVTFDSDKKDIPMAFVGGKKRLFSNVKDDRSGRKDMCGSMLNSGAPFSNTDDQGYGRVGIQKIDLKTNDNLYYDWYEYKIPAGSSDLYSVQIRGINNSSSSDANVLTKQIRQVWGDIWVTLTDPTQISDGKYKAIGIATVNPENNITQDKTRIFIKQNTSLSGMKITMWGIDSKVVTLSDTYDGYYYIDVPQTMPFIQIMSVDSVTKYTKTKLQGGDKILYDYSAGIGGSPAWLTYVPPYIALERERANAESTGRGWALFEYDLTTHRAKTSEAVIAEKLSAMAHKNDAINMADINSDPSAARARANELAKWTIAYQNLYNAIIDARGFLTVKDDGSAVWYPESAELALSGVTYDINDIKALYKLTKEATGEYGNANADINKLIDYTNKLVEMCHDMHADISKKATVILNDVAGWNTGIYVKYVDSYGNIRTVPVTSKNVDGDPMLYIDADPSITNVQFGYSSGGGYNWSSVQPEIKANECYVYNNSPDPGVSGWMNNSAENYFYLTKSTFTQSSPGDTEVVNTGATKPNFVIYFKENSTVSYRRTPSASNTVYTIPAGAYAINIDNYKSYYTGVGSPPTVVDLFSQTAEAYFTDPKNQGLSATGSYSDDSALRWTNSGNIVTHATRLHWNSDVNFVANSGSLNGIYSSYGNISFRWNGTNDLQVTDGTTFEAEGFTIASPKTITAGSAIAPNFTIRNKDLTKKVRVKFLTDTKIKYRDSSGAMVEFEIYQGTYEAINPGPINLFNKDFWQNDVNEIKDDNSNSFLSNPVYS